MTDEVRFDVAGRLGIATLARPQALNALTLGMVRALDATLRAWQSDERIVAVVLQGAPHPTRGPVFCAGADVRCFHAAALSGDPALGDFFTEEFRLDHLVWTYAKPVIALLDGIVMGGGMGLVQGARLRVVTPQMAMAMPETGIGYFPDVGAGHFLARCPGRVGEYLATTGVTIGAADAVAFGLADVCATRASLGAMVEALIDQSMESGAQVLATVTAHALVEHCEAAGHVDPRVPTTGVAGTAPWAADAGRALPDTAALDRHFGQPDMPAILRSLATDPSDWAKSTLALLATRSPLMCAVALAQVRRGRALSLADELRMERGMAHHAFAPGQGEAVEGIRAQVIDKDRRPRWAHATAEAVAPAEVDAFFVDPWGAVQHPLRDLAAI